MSGVSDTMAFALRAAEVAMRESKRRKLDGQKVRDLREAQGLSPTQLAAAAGISEGHLRKIEAGKHLNPTLDVIQGLMDALHCGFDDLTT